MMRCDGFVVAPMERIHGFVKNTLGEANFNRLSWDFLNPEESSRSYTQINADQKGRILLKGFLSNRRFSECSCG